MKRFFERSYTVSLFRRGHISLSTLGFTRGMDRWYFSAYREHYGIDRRHTAVSLEAHCPGVVFNFHLMVK